jgi:outer membrane lipoprotein-sorting protein
MFKISIAATFLLSVFCGLLYGQKVNNISAKFERAIVDNSGRKITRGNIYYIAPQRIILHVEDPVKQHMLIANDTLLIYYPEENRAFRFLGENPFVMPLLYAFIGFFKEDYGLPKAGYKLDKSERKGDTLVVFWTLPKAAEDVLGKIAIGKTKETVVFIEVRDKDDHLRMRTDFKDYRKYSRGYFPSTVLSEQYFDDNRISESINFTNPEFDVELPKELIDFEIPDSLKIIETK